MLPSNEERLEPFMDKLSMWQLLSGLDDELSREKENRKDQLDWMQIFCQDVVEPQYVFYCFLYNFYHICIADSRHNFPNCVSSFETKSSPTPPFRTTSLFPAVGPLLLLPSSAAIATTTARPMRLSDHDHAPCLFL